jgi:CheY-like chemotaxis protein
VSIDGAITGSVAVIRDITDRIRAEEERMQMEARTAQAQRLESLGVLVAGVAHNFNNLLTVIMGYATLRGEETPDAEDRTAYQAITRAAERGKSLVASMVNFGRPSLATKAPLDLIGVAKDLGFLLLNSIANRIVIEEDYPEEPAWVLGDSAILSAVVMNICVNSLDAMPKGGTLTLRVAFPEVGWTELAVSDTGMGMPPEVVAKATEPFFTTKPVGAGTGLGLSSTLGLVQAHVGTLDISSVPEQGTTVRIRLPRLAVAEPADGAAAPAPSAQLAGNLAHVLLVDDDQEVRDVMGRMLIRGGVARVDTAGGGEEALAMLATGAIPDLVILDQNMPGMNGLQTLERIRANWPQLRVLVASGQPDIEQWPEFTGQATATIGKPFTNQEILAKVARMQPLGPPTWLRPPV